MATKASYSATCLNNVFYPPLMFSRPTKINQVENVLIATNCREYFPRATVEF